MFHVCVFKQAYIHTYIQSSRRQCPLPEVFATCVAKMSEQIRRGAQWMKQEQSTATMNATSRCVWTKYESCFYLIGNAHVRCTWLIQQLDKYYFIICLIAICDDHGIAQFDTFT
jgi:hypothetical protein